MVRGRVCTHVTFQGAVEDLLSVQDILVAFLKKTAGLWGVGWNPSSSLGAALPGYKRVSRIGRRNVAPACRHLCL